MATPKLDYERAARVLAHAYFFGKPHACEKYGVATRTFEKYESLRKSDDKLAGLYDQCRDEIRRRPWAAELGETLTISLRRIGSELTQVEVKSIEDMQQLVFLTKELVELEMSRMYAEADTDAAGTDADARRGQGSSKSVAEEAVAYN